MIATQMYKNIDNILIVLRNIVTIESLEWHYQLSCNLREYVNFIFFIKNTFNYTTKKKKKNTLQRRGVGTTSKFH